MKINNQKAINIALAIFIGFTAWLYVIYTTDPSMTRTIKDIPVEFSHKYIMDNSGLAVKSMDVTSVDVTFEGKRSAIGKIKAGDVKAVVDLANAGKGENNLTISISSPNNVSISRKTADDVVVVVEEGTSKEVTGVAEYTDTSDINMEPYVTSIDTEVFSIYGAVSQVDKVSYVRLPLKSENVTNEEKTFNVIPVAVDADGNQVKYVSVTPSSSSVEVRNCSTKIVSLKVNIDIPDDGIYKRTFTAPDTITIKGSDSVLTGISEITTETISAGDYYEGTNIDIPYVLPEGVKIANASIGEVIHLKVVPYTERIIEIPAESVKFRNLDENLTAKLSAEVVEIRVVGLDKDIDGLTAADFTVSADAKDFDENTYLTELKVKTEADVYSVSTVSDEVYVDVSSK